MWWMAASMANVSAWKTVECLPRKPFPSANSSGLFGSVLEKMQQPYPVLLLMCEPSVQISIGVYVVHAWYSDLLVMLFRFSVNLC